MVGSPTFKIDGEEPMKKIMSKKLLTLCAVATFACMLPLTASAVDKLVVKSNDTIPVPVFAVDDTGMVTGNKLGMGTATPQAPLHLNLKSNYDGQIHPVGTSLYNVSTGFVQSTQDNSASLDLTVADDYGIAGYRGAIRGVRSRGSLEYPTAAGTGDGIVSLLAGVYDGTTVLNNADVKFIVDGPVSTGVAPVRISFRTKLNGGAVWKENLTIKPSGNIGINEAAPTSLLHVTGLPVYANNAAAIAGELTAGAFYRTADGVLMVCY